MIHPSRTARHGLFIDKARITPYTILISLVQEKNDQVVILNEVKDLVVKMQILRFAQNDKRGVRKTEESIHDDRF